MTCFRTYLLKIVNNTKTHIIIPSKSLILGLISYEIIDFILCIINNISIFYIFAIIYYITLVILLLNIHRKYSELSKYVIISNFNNNYIPSKYININWLSYFFYFVVVSFLSCFIIENYLFFNNEISGDQYFHIYRLVKLILGFTILLLDQLIKITKGERIKFNSILKYSIIIAITLIFQYLLINHDYILNNLLVFSKIFAILFAFSWPILENFPIIFSKEVLDLSYGYFEFYSKRDSKTWNYITTCKSDNDYSFGHHNQYHDTEQMDLIDISEHNNNEEMDIDYENEINSDHENEIENDEENENNDGSEDNENLESVINPNEALHGNNPDYNSELDQGSTYSVEEYEETEEEREENNARNKELDKKITEEDKKKVEEECGWENLIDETDDEGINPVRTRLSNIRRELTDVRGNIREHDDAILDVERDMNDQERENREAGLTALEEDEVRHRTEELVLMSKLKDNRK